MALQNEVAPPLVGDINKDTKIEGKSDEPEHDSADTEEGEDLEEGEILDSGEEENTNDEEPKTKSSPATNASGLSPDDKEVPTEMQDILKLYKKKVAALEQLVEDKKEKKRKRAGDQGSSHEKKRIKYIDHDRMSDDDENDPETEQWFKTIQRKSSFGDGPIDYRKELAAYRGSSPEGDSSKRSRDEKRKKKEKSSRLRKKSSTRTTKRKRLDVKGRRKKEKKTCRFFLDGKCSKGSDCPFLHAGAPFKRKELCKYYLNGFCAKNNQCIYMHDDFPCKFYHTGSKCFADKNCRFSHEPLTEETRKLLDDYLKAYHGDDYDPRKRVVNNSPEPRNNKRPCLLGSPPQGEATKRWQEEMMQLLKEQGSSFKIDIGPSHSPPPLSQPTFQSPSRKVRPNFYMDTLQSPPQVGPSFQNHPHSVPAPIRMDDTTRIKTEEEEEDEGEEIMDQSTLDWKNICALVNKFSEQEENACKSEDVKKSVPAQSIKQEPVDDQDCANVVSGNSFEEHFHSQGIQKEIPDHSENISSVKPSQPNNLDDNSQQTSPSGVSTSALTQEASSQEPIVIPSHLPRKQRELLLRIQKHQKLNSAATADDETKAGSDIGEKPELDSQCSQSSIAEDKDENEETTSTEKSKETWYSSDDDDDDDDIDKPLRDVLKKIQQTPPPKIPDPPPTTRPAFSISQMLSNIMQKANETNRTSNVTSEQDAFWKNILSGAVPSTKTSTQNSTVVCNTILQTSSKPTLPDLRSTLTEKPSLDIRDPRLKNRDPRTAASNKIQVSPITSTSSAPPVFPALDTGLSSSVSNRVRDLSTVIPNQTPAIVVDGLKGNVPYKLHNVTTKPLNYMPYIQASHSDPKLLNDPRLRKHMAQRNITSQTTQPNSDKTLLDSSTISIPKPGLPDLPLFTQLKEKADPFSPLLQDNNFLTTIKSPPRIEMPTLPEIKLPPVLPGPKTNDPRARRLDQQIRRLSENDAMPQLTPETNWTPPPNPPIVPNPASHLPRAIADPRMAKLHHPVDPRRSRITVTPDPVNKSSNLTNKPPPVTEGIKLEKVLQINETDVKPNNQPVTDTNSECIVKENTSITKKQKSISDNDCKKNKAIHRNRKSSMDYASPLNSCDDSNTSSSLNYNSYNQRPKRVLNVPDSNIKDMQQFTNDVLESLYTNPELSISDNSNLESDNLEISASLKDMFKTKDPTASPFC